MELKKSFGARLNELTDEMFVSVKNVFLGHYKSGVKDICKKGFIIEKYGIKFSFKAESDDEDEEFENCIPIQRIDIYGEVVHSFICEIAFDAICNDIVVIDEDGCEYLLSDLDNYAKILSEIADKVGNEEYEVCLAE